MTQEATFALRKEELRRRVEALPKELKAWKGRTTAELDSNAYFSQVQAIGILVDALITPQTESLNTLNPASDSAAFTEGAFDLVLKIIRAQRVWDFFRDKLDLRFSPQFKEPLWVADTVAWDCYRPVLDTAADAGILPRTHLREPPLIYLTAEFSPATWVRGSRPNDGREYHLGTSRLPVPVIELPWDHVENSWEFLTLHHEVGHDLEADLKLRGVLAANLNQRLTDAGVPAERIARWLSWQGEVFADLVGLQLAGPAFAEALLHLLLLPSAQVTTVDPEDPHPTHYPRVLMNAAYIPTMISNDQALADHAQQVSASWVAIYGQQLQFDEILADFPLVVAALMDTPLAELQGKTVRELMLYTKADDARIRNAVGYMRTGQNKPATLRPRHCVSAGRLAISEATREGALSEDLLDQINQRTMALVRENAPVGLRAGDGSAPHKQFIASFAAGL